MPAAGGTGAWRRHPLNGNMACPTSPCLCKIPGFFLHLGERCRWTSLRLRSSSSRVSRSSRASACCSTDRLRCRSPRGHLICCSRCGQEAGLLATKDELLGEVWSGRIVEDVNLSVNISLLRRALARPGRIEGVIQTVPKAGYRFVAPVTRRLVGAISLLPRGTPGRELPPVANPDAQRA